MDREHYLAAWRGAVWAHVAQQVNGYVAAVNRQALLATLPAQAALTAVNAGLGAMLTGMMEGQQEVYNDLSDVADGVAADLAHHMAAAYGAAVGDISRAQNELGGHVMGGLASLGKGPV